MTSVSYLILATISQKDVEDVEGVLAILNIAGRGQAFLGSSSGNVSTNLWIIPKDRRNKQDVTTMLQAIPSIRSVSVVTLSNPAREQELVKVRHLFTRLGLDASDVTDDALSLFINAKLKGLYTYYIHYDNIGKEPVKIQVRPIKEHPHFSPDWLKARNRLEDEMSDKEFTIDDIEIRSVVLEKMDEIEEIEPPPPPPTNEY